MSAEARKAAVADFYEEIWNRRDRRAVDRLVTADLAFRGSLGATKRGRAGFWSYVEEVTAALHDYRCDVQEVVADRDQAFAKVSFSGLHRGVLLGFPPTGHRLDWVGAAHFKFRDEQIASLWVLGDLYGLTERLRQNARRGAA